MTDPITPPSDRVEPAGSPPASPPPVPDAGVDEPASGLLERDVSERAFDAGPEADVPVTATGSVEGRALIIGEALVDVVHLPDGSTAEHPGGSPANVALGLARLGRDAHLLTWFGKDVRGATVRRHLEESGVTVLPGSDGAPRTSVAVATVDDSGAATYEFDLTWQVPKRWTGPAGAPQVVHTGSIAAVLEPGAADVVRIVTAHRQSATITYDPNVRPSLMPDVDRTRALVAEMVQLADVVKVSEEDLAWLHPGSHIRDVARLWAEAGPALVVVTRGGDGATAMTSSGHELDIAAQPVTVADTVGAGDSFMSGLIDGLWTANLLGADRRHALHDAGDAELRSALLRCTQIAAVTVSRPGANPPTAAEMDAAG